MPTIKALALILCAACAAHAGAQTTYTAKLRKSEPGKGTVVIVQSDEIERIVNTPLQKTAPAAEKRNTEKAQTERHATKPATTAAHPAATPSHPASAAAHSGAAKENSHSATEMARTERAAQGEAHRHVARTRHKAQGYRICIYTGGNSRKDREAAARMGNTCRKYFSELAVYTSFESPRWVTHVGDFRTKEEAQKYVTLIRRKHFTYETRIVRSTVNLPD